MGLSLTNEAQDIVTRLMNVRNAERRRAIEDGYPIEARALDDSEYRGISIGLPRFIEALTWKTFRKTFHRDPSVAGLELRGWNVRMEQTGILGEGVPRTENGVPMTWGHYRIVAGSDVPMPWSYQKGLVIDYNVPQNRGFDRRIRDPLVALIPNSVELLLGFSYIDIFGGTRTPSFFLLLREGPLSNVPSP